MVETLVGVLIFALLLAVTVMALNNIRESKRIERTLSAIYVLKEEVRKVSRNRGSYTKGGMMPLLFASNSFPNTLDIDYDKRVVKTPMGHSLDIMGRGQYFSIDLTGLTPNDCYDLGEQIVAGNFFSLGSKTDDFEVLQIGGLSFNDFNPLTHDDLEKACTQSFSIDVIMAFR